MPTKLCPDGKTTAGPTGRCHALADGSCTWEVASCPATTCKLTDCGPALGMPNKLCPDGKTMSGPTSNCVVQPSGQCGWEFIDCPVPVDCYGICVPNVANGCKADTECPSGEKCEMACTASACAGSATDPTACTCPAGDRSCTCDANGNCGGQSCVGKCVPATPVCNAPVACPASIPACADGQKPVSTGTDPTTCCPIYQCPRCASTGPNGSTCPVPACICAKVTGTDATTCCPTYVCGQVDPTTNQCL
jgi:hypothetical protein